MLRTPAAAPAALVVNGTAFRIAVATAGSRYPQILVRLGSASRRVVGFRMVALLFVALTRMTVMPTARSLVNTIDVMNVADVRLHVGTTRPNVVWCKFLLFYRRDKLFVKAVLDSG